MRFDRFTIKAQEALETAQNLAAEVQSPELGVQHLMLALIRQTDGIATPILQKLGVDTVGITSAVEALSKKHRKSKAQRRKCVLPLPYNPFWILDSRKRRHSKTSTSVLNIS